MVRRAHFVRAAMLFAFAFTSIALTGCKGGGGGGGDVGGAAGDICTDPSSCFTADVPPPDANSNPPPPDDTYDPEDPDDPSDPCDPGDPDGGDDAHHRRVTGAKHQTGKTLRANLRLRRESPYKAP